jgi:hypothetical protein
MAIDPSRLSPRSDAVAPGRADRRADVSPAAPTPEANAAVPADAGRAPAADRADVPGQRRVERLQIAEQLRLAGERAGLAQAARRDLRAGVAELEALDATAARVGAGRPADLAEADAALARLEALDASPDLQTARAVIEDEAEAEIDTVPPALTRELEPPEPQPTLALTPLVDEETGPAAERDAAAARRAAIADRARDLLGDEGQGGLAPAGLDLSGAERAEGTRGLIAEAVDRARSLEVEVDRLGTEAAASARALTESLAANVERLTSPDEAAAAAQAVAQATAADPRLALATQPPPSAQIALSVLG